MFEESTVWSWRTKAIPASITIGLALSIITGVLENIPNAGVIRVSHYGYSLAWRIVKIYNPNQPMEMRGVNLGLDTAFWTLISLTVFSIIRRKSGGDFRKKLMHLRPRSCGALVIYLFLFILLGLAMDLVHEVGHAIWGTIMGGSLSNMKIAFFQIYPSPSITSEFVLGYTVVEGLSSGFSRGVFLIGGSLTTQLTSWLLVPIQLRIRLGLRARLILWALGLFGLLDLPFYILFPQIGLKHWIFLGGSIAEPLIGARLMKVTDSLFYTITLFTTLILGFIYVKVLKSIIQAHTLKEYDGAE